jgi:hypothetical protein
MGDLSSVRDAERDGRGALWRDHVSRSGHVQADQGFGAHRMEKGRREGGGVPGQLLGTGGGAGECALAREREGDRGYRR